MDKVIQKQMLLDVFPLAVECQVPVVIHCRGLSRGLTANDECQGILARCLPHDHPVHLHCFSGRVKEARN